MYTCVGVVTYLVILVNYPVNVTDTVSVNVKTCWFDIPRTVFFKFELTVYVRSCVLRMLFSLYQVTKH
jgi:hypothetical protein